ncbi:MAG: L,D-transpeptidase family protein [Planctomycetota bacterium]
MALPSQQQRGGGMGPRLTGGRSRRRRRGRARRVVALVFIVACLGVVVWQWPSITGGGAGVDREDALAQGETNDDTQEPAANTGAAQLVVNRPAATPVRQPEPTPPQPSRERETVVDNEQPRELTMGAVAEESVAPEREDRVTPPATSPNGFGVTSRTAEAIERADGHLAANRPVEARDVLNRALYAGGLNATDVDLLRARLAEISETLTFSPRAYPDDAMSETYTVKRGDALSVIPRRAGLRVDYRLIQRLNRIADPSRIRLGQSLKVLKGPFHAIVDKSAFRLDLYAEQTDSAGNRLYIRSFPVGLGEYGTTPVGDWVVRDAGKVINPAWVNPRTGERFDKDDPDIPIGEHWIALEGTDPETELLDGYGIHGTNEPESIGMELSMGCVRMLADDVRLMYELLVEGTSTVRIVE